MPSTYAPRTVALVALVSLVLGFVVVFGGGMILLRPRARLRPVSSGSVRGTSRAPIATTDSDASYVAAPTASPDVEGIANSDDDAGGASSTDASAPTAAAPSAPAPPPVAAAGITVNPASISRCFDQGPPTPIAGAHCDRPGGLDAYFASKAPQIAACARNGAHGRLALLLDFRFSTSFIRGWGSPTSNIPNPGIVAACVKRAVTPLPFANLQHQHDRYIIIVAIDW